MRLTKGIEFRAEINLVNLIRNKMESESIEWTLLYIFSMAMARQGY